MTDTKQNIPYPSSDDRTPAAGDLIADFDRRTLGVVASADDATVTYYDGAGPGSRRRCRRDRCEVMAGMVVDGLRRQLTAAPGSSSGPAPAAVSAHEADPFYHLANRVERLRNELLAAVNDYEGYPSADRAEKAVGKALGDAIAALNETSANLRGEWLAGDLITSDDRRAPGPPPGSGQVRDASGRVVSVGDFAWEPNAVAELGMVGIVIYIAAPSTIVVRNHEGEARHMSAGDCESISSVAVNAA